MSVMKLKVDENGVAVLSKDGHPVYVWDDGKEEAIDVPKLFQVTLPSNRKENKEWREKAEALAERLKVLEGIESPEEYLAEAKKAIETLKNLDEKKLVDAGEVEKLKAGVARNYEERIAQIEKEYTKKLESANRLVSQKENFIADLLIKGAFESSEFIRDKTVLPAEIAYDTFKRYFKIENDADGRPIAVAYDRNGERILSRANPTKFADPEEAIQEIISTYPQKDKILRADGEGTGVVSRPGPNGKGIVISQKEWQNRISTAKSAEERKELTLKAARKEIIVQD